MVTIYWILTKSSIQWLLSKKKIKFPSFCIRWALINFDNMKGTKTVLTHEGLFEVKWMEGRMYKREDIIIVPIQTFPLSILAFSPLPPRHQVTSRDNHWWRHSLAHVVEDGVWYTLRGENFYYRNVRGNASPPNKKCLSSEGVLQLTSPPPFFGAYVSRRKMLENQSSHFLKKSENNYIFGKQFN